MSGISPGSNVTACLDSHPFDAGSHRALKAVTITSAVLSVFGSCFIIASFNLQRGIRRSLGMHVIFYLSVSDLLSSLIFIIDGLAPTGELAVCTDVSDVAALCAFNATAAQFSGLAAVLWTGCIALGLHLGILRSSKLALQQPMRLLQRMHVGVWSAAVLSLIIMWAANTLGPTGQWCWIKRDKVWAMAFFYYVPLLAVFVYSMAIYYLTRRSFFRLHREASKAGESAAATVSSGALPSLTRRLRLFLLVFGVINGFQLLNRTYDFFAPGNPSFALYMLQSIFGPLQGVGNAVAYGTSPLVRRVWAGAFPRACGWLAPVESPVRPAQIEISPAGGLAGEENGQGCVVAER